MRDRATGVRERWAVSYQRRSVDETDPRWTPKSGHTWKSCSRTWAGLHENSFRRLGGAPRVVVLDNLKEGVLAPDIHEPSLNPIYRDVLKHYGAVAIPCLLGRRIKAARFREPGKTLDTFDFDFNKKMDRRLIFELATARFVSQHEDVFFPMRRWPASARNTWRRCSPCRSW